ncbi:MAG: alkaline phosphatase PhoX, partial [Actinomycetes bacterium]
QVPDALHFDGGEGIDCSGDKLWFTTKGDVRVWEYVLSTQQVSIRFQGGSGQTLNAVDNLWVDDQSGALFVAEDGGNMEVVVIRPNNTAEAVVRVEGQQGSEITGPCFSPDGQRLYFSSQRGPATVAGLPFGITYEVTGPWDQLLGRA